VRVHIGCVLCVCSVCVHVCVCVCVVCMHVLKDTTLPVADDEDWEDMEEEQVNIGMDNGYNADAMVRGFVHLFVVCYFVTAARQQ